MAATVAVDLFSSNALVTPFQSVTEDMGMCELWNDSVYYRGLVKQYHIPSGHFDIIKFRDIS